MRLWSATIPKAFACALVAGLIFSSSLRSREAGADTQIQPSISAKQREALHIDDQPEEPDSGVITAFLINEPGEEATVDGFAAPSGTTIFSGQTTTTSDGWAVIYITTLKIKLRIAPRTRISVSFPESSTATKPLEFKCECDRKFRVEIFQGPGCINITAPSAKKLCADDKPFEGQGDVVGNTDGNLDFSVMCQSVTGAPRRSAPRKPEPASLWKILIGVPAAATIDLILRNPSGRAGPKTSPIVP